MPAGDLVVLDGQYEFNGLLLGSGTPFVVTKADGIIGLPTTTSINHQKLRSHGSVPGVITIDKRVITLDVSIDAVGGADIENKILQLARAFQIPILRNTRKVIPFVFRRAGQVKKQSFARCDRRDFSSTYEVAHGLSAGLVQLVAPDPVVYSLVQNSATNSSMTAGTTTSGSSNVFNAGDHAEGVNPIVEIVGPARNPRVVWSVGTETRTFGIDNDIQANERIVIDFSNRNIIVVDASTAAYVRDGFPFLRTDSQWFTLTPGNNSLYWTRSAAALTGSAGTLAVRWYDGWA